MHNKKYNLIRNLALLFIVGNMVGWVFPFPNIVWRVSLVLLSLYVVLFEEGKRLPCEKALLFFIAFNLLHFAISFLWGTPSSTQIGNILCALLPLSLFTCIAEKGVMTDKYVSIMAVILVIAGIMQFYHYEQMVLIKKGIEDMNVTNNASVALLMLLPMLFLVKSQLQKWITLLVCIFFILAGAKRGNILAAIIPVCLFVWFSLKDSRRSGVKIILVLAIIVAGAFMTYRWISNNDYLLYRVEQAEEGNSSGRDVIYAGAWHTWYDSEYFVHQLFGLGFDGILSAGGTNQYHAHNDWLEVLVNYGLLGIVLYMSVFITLFKQVRRIKSFEMRMALLSGILIWFLKTFYSMGFTSETLSVAMISMGTALGWYKMERNQA